MICAIIYIHVKIWVVNHIGYSEKVFSITLFQLHDIWQMPSASRTGRFGTCVGSVNYLKICQSCHFCCLIG